MMAFCGHDIRCANFNEEWVLQKAKENVEKPSANPGMPPRRLSRPGGAQKRTLVKEMKEGGLDNSGVIALLAARPVMLTLVEQPPD